MTTPTPLSPAAQAALKAADDAISEWPPVWEKALAAALRAAADQVIPLTKTSWGSTLVPVLTAQESRERLLAIAAELDGGAQ